MKNVLGVMVQDLQHKTDIFFSTHYPCPDCEGTGFKYGKRAEKEWERQVEERWRKAERLNSINWRL